MIQQSGFHEEVLDLLRSNGWVCTISKKETDVLYSARVFKNDQFVLAILLVDLHTWKNASTAKDELLLFAGEQKALWLEGVKCVVLWEDVWRYRHGIVCSRLCALMGISQKIPARLTQVRRIDKKTSAGFLDKNHLQGNVLSKTQYGLYLPERYYRVLEGDIKSLAPAGEMLVAVSTFSHARVFDKEGDSYRSFELIRFANLLNTTVIGGVAKLLRAFIRDFSPGDIMTYADLEWSDGASYRSLGFLPVSDMQPLSFSLNTQTGSRVRIGGHAFIGENEIMISNLGSRKFVLDLRKG